MDLPPYLVPVALPDGQDALHRLVEALGSALLVTLEITVLAFVDGDRSSAC